MVGDGKKRETINEILYEEGRKRVRAKKNKRGGVTISLRTGVQGHTTPIHTQRPTQPPFQQRHLLKKV